MRLFRYQVTNFTNSPIKKWLVAFDKKIEDEITLPSINIAFMITTN